MPSDSFSGGNRQYHVFYHPTRIHGHQSIHRYVAWWSLIVSFYPRSALAFGYCCCLRLYVCVSVCLYVNPLLVRTIIRDPFKVSTCCTYIDLGSQGYFGVNVALGFIVVDSLWQSNSTWCHIDLGLYSLSGWTSYRKIPWSLEAARLDVSMMISLENLLAISAAAEMPVKF